MCRHKASLACSVPSSSLLITLTFSSALVQFLLSLSLRALSPPQHTRLHHSPRVYTTKFLLLPFLSFKCVTASPSIAMHAHPFPPSIAVVSASFIPFTRTPFLRSFPYNMFLSSHLHTPSLLLAAQSLSSFRHSLPLSLLPIF